MRGFFKKIRKPVESFRFQKLSGLLFYVALVIIGLSIFFLTSPTLNFSEEKYQPFSILRNDVVVNSEIEIIDQYTTNLIKEQTIQKEGLFFRRHSKALDDNLQTLKNAFNKFRSKATALDKFRLQFNQTQGVALFNLLNKQIEAADINSSLALTKKFTDALKTKSNLEAPQAQSQASKSLEETKVDLQARLKTLEQDEKIVDSGLKQIIDDAKNYIIKKQTENTTVLLDDLGINKLNPDDPLVQSALADPEIEAQLAQAITQIHKIPFIDDQTIKNKQPNTNVKIVSDFETINLGSILAVPNKQAMVKDVLKTSFLRKNYNFAKIFLETIVTPNLIYDEQYTKEALDKVTKDLREVKILLKKGEVLARKGERISVEKASILQGYQQASSQIIQYPKLIGTFLLIWFMIVVLILIIKYNTQKSESLNNQRKLAIIALSVLLLQVIVSKIIIELSLPIFESFSSFLKTTQLYILPLGMAPILVVVLANRKIALTVGIISAVFTSLLFTNNANNLIFPLASNFLTSSLLTRSKIVTRSDILSLGIKVSAANAALVLMLSLVEINWQVGEEIYLKLALSCIYGALGGLLAAFLSIIILPIWEYIFDIKTDIKLLEWSTTNHPLLKELLDKAPGSYHHSIAVGSISEAGAVKIGANAIFCRIASYFHDIGKTHNPSFFIENMRDINQNPHIMMDDPVKSKDIIIGHVLKGIELAKKHDLGKQLTDIIRQHHGTTLVRFFYLQTKKKLALGLLTPSQVSEKNFRYPGPKPQTPEAALIMLADICEATVRSIKNPTVQKIKAAIKSVSNHILEDGQLDESRISLRDFKAIQSTYTDILIAQNHSRILIPS